jgi:NCAIR mutase (PurE)-related protein
MSTETLREVLEMVAEGHLSVSEAQNRLAHLPFEDLGFARVDHHRAIRGIGPEVVYARSKTPAQVAAIAAALLRREGAPVLVTKADKADAQAVLAANPEAIWHERSGMIVLRRVAVGPPGRVLVLCAGTSDLPVAEEAVVTAEAFGCRVELVADVGVAGPHRLFAEAERLRRTDVLIVVAGMEWRCPRWPPACSAGRRWPSRPASATGPPSTALPPYSACSTPARSASASSTSTTDSGRA